METTASGWTVIDRDRAVLTRSYVFDAKRGASANCFVARLPDGTLMVLSPPVLDAEEAFEELAAFGAVGAVVASNGFHHLGLATWRARFPAARLFAPAQAMDRIRKKNAQAPALEPVSELVKTLGDDLRLTELPNTKCGECIAHAAIDGGRAYFTSDVLANMPRLPAAFPIKQLMKWTGSAPGYRVFGLALKFIVKDKKAVLRELRGQMSDAPPTVVVPGHGDLLAGPTIAAQSRSLLDSAC